MRNNDDIIEFQRSLNGSYEPIIIHPEVQQENKTTEPVKQASGTEPLQRNRRSLNHMKGKTYGNRKIKKFTTKISKFPHIRY